MGATCCDVFRVVWVLVLVAFLVATAPIRSARIKNKQVIPYLNDVESSNLTETKLAILIARTGQNIA